MKIAILFVVLLITLGGILASIYLIVISNGQEGFTSLTAVIIIQILFLAMYYKIERSNNDPFQPEVEP